MQHLMDTRVGDDWATPLLVAGGLLPALGPQMREQLLIIGKDIPELTAQTVTGVALVLGVLSGVLQATFWPLLLHLAARLMGTAGTPWRGARLAAAWSSLPVLLCTLLSPLLGDLLPLLTLPLSLWSLVLLAFMLARGYGLGTGQGAVAVGLALLLGLALLTAMMVLLALLGVSARMH